MNYFKYECQGAGDTDLVNVWRGIIRRSWTIAIILIVFLIAAEIIAAFFRSPAFAEPSEPANETSETSRQEAAQDDFLTRPRLTGDWGGVRSSLAENGVTMDLRYTAFYQGMVSGTGNKDFEYSGKIDAFVNLNSERMGLWKGGGFYSHFEYSHGDAPTNLGGALFSTNTARLWPIDAPEEVVATSLYFNQKVGDRSSIAFGKFNPIDLLAADPFFGGWGIDRFMNLIFVAPPSGLVPPIFMGAITTLKTNPVSWTLMVFDPDDRTTDYLPGDLFSNGVNFSLTGTHASMLAGRKTTYAVTANYSTAEGTDYSILPSGLETTTKQGSYNIAFQFTHNLQESRVGTDASWGYYLKVALADGNPNYVKSSLITGIGGRALFFGRPQDSFGIGAFYYDLSDDLQETLDPFTEFSDESAIEAFYSYFITPWISVTADIQYIDPASGSYDRALVASMRTQIRF